MTMDMYLSKIYEGLAFANQYTAETRTEQIKTTLVLSQLTLKSFKSLADRC